jgi:hypothetical protein
LLGYGDYTFGNTAGDIGDEEFDWELNAATLGIVLNGNFEIALSYDWNIGAGASYRIMAPTDEWTYTEDGEEVDFEIYDPVPALDMSGLGFQVYLTWSLPSLGYDPVAAARGALGH